MSPDQNTSMSTSSDMITKDFIKEIARTMGNSPSLAVDDDFVNITNKIMASFIEKTAEMTAMLAHHRTNNRNDTKVEPNDVQIALDKLWKIRVPGYLLDPHDVATTRQARKKRRVAGLEKNSAAVVLSHHRKLHTVRLQATFLSLI